MPRFCSNQGLDALRRHSHPLGILHVFIGTWFALNAYMLRNFSCKSGHIHKPAIIFDWASVFKNVIYLAFNPNFNF